MQPTTGAPSPSATRRPTVKDVARVAGVGVGTVSRVLNAEGKVSADSRSRVTAAIDELGYVRDTAARELRRGASASVGLLVEDVADPFYSQLHRAVESALDRHDLTVLAASSGGSSSQVRRIVDGLAARRVEGLVVTMPMDADESRLASMQRDGVHVVFVDRPALTFEADSVLTDSRRGARMGIEHLLARGHRRIAVLLDDARNFTSGERLAGVLDAIDAAGLARDAVEVSQAAPDVEAVAARLASLLAGEEPPTAIFSGNNRTTVATLRATRALGVRLDVVGFDDLELADLLDPPLTVVAQDASAIGAIASQLLVDRLDGHDGPARRRLVDPVLIVRAP
ncbi:LacI family DNA-binding transcriptional regulator [Agrococcus jejuensis]|uniref:LacI family DNA-binding transcriptional regulator n=1 Tax=Agrococcus jejuensis TaxID=399736 RepID=UPI00119D5091|nr:LacI family DNA-binding transcriptional regulator [Agrococcus jejuensis]